MRKKLYVKPCIILATIQHEESIATGSTRLTIYKSNETELFFEKDEELLFHTYFGTGREAFQDITF
ncbi:hypothetical protein J5U18_08360 [Sphingobacteriaceae bacterium WQ 2009]|uniref:Uncharacterized protein n=1 Tax=Rhinopithecimicrobium faecis TaxID=2820698 RepID=A0A8T4H953_9SPHI|nr:hypothetical protein [Sphingobacteriaceae bacterium WQ 2009]